MLGRTSPGEGLVMGTLREITRVFSFHSAVASLQDNKANIECLALENHALAVTQFNPCTIIN